jgi:8-oxo-dGTP pyrophosphatase MutT (NUDIX family)
MLSTKQQRSLMTTATQLAAGLARSARAPTKAGGIVVRPKKGTHEMLLVSSRSRPGRWTLPKGTLERGEHPQFTAAREIAEEAGVRGRLICRLGTVARSTQTITFYLFRFRHDVAWVENRFRERRWVDLAKAERFLRQDDLHGIVAEARRTLAR